MTTETATTYMPIRTLAEQTGVASTTLRAWERRYGLLTPQRTPTGHRLFTHTDVERVQQIVALMRDGHTLPNIALLLQNSSQSPQTDNPTTAVAPQPTTSTVWQNYIEDTINAIHDFSSERIDTIYNEAIALYPIHLVVENLLQPTLAHLGTLWQSQPQSGIAEEHFYSSWLKNRLGAQFHHSYSRASGSKIVCACLPGCYHEIGLMLFAIAALARGYRILYFGANLPLQQIPYITGKAAVKAVVVASHAATDPFPITELMNLPASINLPLFLGGTYPQHHTAPLQQAGITLLGDNIAVATHVLERLVPLRRGME